MPIHGQFFYPGIRGPQALEYYVNSHGISPGVALLRCIKGTEPPAMNGDLLITDSVNGEIKVPDCRLDTLQTTGPGATTWMVYLQDRRWRWQFGFIDLCVNQLDDNKKLIPGSIMSAEEIAILCLTKMGEVGYSIDLPPGLTTAQRLQPLQFLPTGVNYPPRIGGNPGINWVARNPAQALQELCEMFGRRIVYQLSTNTVAIVKAGVGGPLPPGGSIFKDSPSLKAPAMPDAITIKGAPTCYQTRLLLQAVALEWDDTYVPADQVSYAPPVRPETNQITWCHVEVPPDSLDTVVVFQLFIGPLGTDAEEDGAMVAYSGNAGDDAETIVGKLLNLVNSSTDQRIKGVVSATANGDVLVLNGIGRDDEDGPLGFAFGTKIVFPGTPPENADAIFFYPEVTQAAEKQQGGWATCLPPLFPTVQATDRLTVDQARKRAQASVYKCFQVADVDVTTGQGTFGKPSITIPGYPSKVFRSQLILLPKQVDQITPQKSVPGASKVGAFDPQVFLDYYQGLSKSQGPRVYGSVCRRVMSDSDKGPGIVFEGSDDNTDSRDLVMVPFTIDPLWQVVTFQNVEAVYVNKDTSGWGFPALALQTAVHVRNQLTWQIESFEMTVPLALGATIIDGGTGQPVNIPITPITAVNPLVQFHDDCQLNVTSNYVAPNQLFLPSGTPTLPNQLLSWNILEADPILRGSYYVYAAWLQLQLAAAETRGYLGLIPIDCDGAIQQVVWSLGERGCQTVAGMHNEFFAYFPPYHERRRAEDLPAIQEQAERNKRRLLPQPGERQL
jgi:hypothetical protein